MSVEIFDTHAHLDMSDYDTDREEVIKRSFDSGVTRIVTVGIDVDSSRKAIALSEKYSSIYASVGFHPHESRFMNPSDKVELTRLAGNSRVLAIGEIGLDYYRMTSPRDVQVKTFETLLDLAGELDLPVIIHSRRAEKDIIDIILKWVIGLDKGRKAPVGVIHCFSGDITTAKLYLDMGFYIAFGAYIGYPNSHLEEVIRYIPEQRLVVETDCPFLPPQAFRGKRNEPSYLPGTVEVLARIRGVSLETLAVQTTENALRLFQLKG